MEKALCQLAGRFLYVGLARVADHDTPGAPPQVVKVHNPKLK
jgi:hypothetical protein